MGHAGRLILVHAGQQTGYRTDARVEKCLQTLALGAAVGHACLRGGTERLAHQRDLGLAALGGRYAAAHLGQAHQQVQPVVGLRDA